jgi:hypothetical protein
VRAIELLIEKWHRCLVLDRDVVQPAVVNAHPERSVLLLDKQHRRTERRCAATNEAAVQQQPHLPLELQALFVRKPVARPIGRPRARLEIDHVLHAALRRHARRRLAEHVGKLIDDPLHTHVARPVVGHRAHNVVGLGRLGERELEACDRAIAAAQRARALSSRDARPETRDL